MMRIAYLVILLLGTVTPALALMLGAAPTPPAGGILLPLAGGSLATTNSGTLTFPGSSGWYGFDVKSNGSLLNMQAVGICTATNGVCLAGGARTFFKFKSVLETPTWHATDCLADGLGVVQTSDAPGGASVTDRNGVVWTWDSVTSPNYNIKRNGTNFTQGDRMILADDGMMYWSQNVASTAHLYWWGYSPYPTPTTGTIVWSGVVPPTTYAAGNLRAVSACPAGL